MSAPVRVRRNVFGQWVAYCYACPTGSGTVSHCDAQPAAIAAALAHLRLRHAPIVQTVVSSTRCTCGDTPASSWPYFQPCPVHVWTVNATNTPTMYSRRCGVSLAACEANECVCARNHTGVVSGPQRGVQRSSCDHGFPCCCTHDNPLQTAHNQSREDC